VRYFRTVPTVRYFRTGPTVRYFLFFILFNKAKTISQSVSI
jgi:hypothetical protein